MHSLVKSGMAALGAVLLTSGAAVAAPAEEKPFYYFCTVAESHFKHCAGKGTFDSDGDILHVGDTRSDGASVTVGIGDSEGRQHTFHVDEGAGKIKTYNLNFKEGETLAITIFLTAPGHQNAGERTIKVKA